MDILRRAISMPLLCRDDQLAAASSSVINRRSAQKPIERPTSAKRPSNAKQRMDRVRKSWSRLLEGHSVTKIDDPDPSPGIPVPDPPDNNGSSVDLAPSLLNIYDNYVTSTDDLTKPVVPRDAQPKRSVPRPATPPVPRGFTKEDRQNRNVVHIHVEEVNNVPSPGTPRLKTTCSPSGGVRKVTMKEPESRGVQDRLSPSGVPGSDHDQHGLSLSAFSDAKKRPLSISSTASSSSSTSSLPRQQRKKIATTSSSLLVQGYHGEDAVNSTPHKGGQCVTVDAGHHHDHISPIRPRGVQHAPEEAMATEEDEFQVMDQVPEEQESDLSSSTDYHHCDFIHSLDLNRSDYKSPSPSPLPSNGAAVFEDSGFSYIDRVVAEIVETEKTYVKDLTDIIQGYLQQIRKRSSIKLRSSDIDGLFSNIEEIYDFNRGFLASLERCQADPVLVADCFVDNSEGFVIYTDYCTNYPRSVEILTQCMLTANMADVFKQFQVSLHHSLPLGSYLLKPVQRILKYHLFLQNILNNYDKCKSDYECIEAALSVMTNVAQHINEMKRKHEHAVRIQEIQSILYGWEGADLTTFGDIVLEDTFRMYGAKAYRHIFLMERGLLIAKKKEDGNLMCKATIMCSNLMLIESIPKEPLSFHLIPFDNPKIQYTAQAKNLEQKRHWCYEIKRLILENYNVAIPDKAKELVMKLGKSKEEEGLSNFQLEHATETPRKQHSAPEYLEKRRERRRRSTSIIPGVRKGDGSPKSSPKNRRRSDSNRGQSPLALASSVLNITRAVRGKGTNSRDNTLTRSKSLESVQQEDVTEETVVPSVQPDEQSLKSYDDASERASRISQLLDQEGLTAQLSADNLQQDIEWDQDMVSSVLNVSTVKRAESFRIATHLNRVDSTSAAQARRRRRKYGIYEKRENGEHLKPCGLTNGVDIAALDDGYVTVVHNMSGFHIDQSQDKPLYSNVVLHSGWKNPAVKSKDTNVNTPLPMSQAASVIANDYAKSTDSLDGKPHHNHGCVKTRESCGCPDSTSCRNVSIYDNVPSGPYENVILGSTRHPKYHNNRPVSGSSTGSGGSPVKVVSSTSSSSLICNVCSPQTRRKLPAGSDTKENNEVTDPWIRRTPARSRNRPQPRRIWRQHSVGAADNVIRNGEMIQPKPNKLYRSNSLSSLTESKENLLKECTQKGHHRRTSDTLIFSNRSAFLASNSSRSFHPDRDAQRIIDRLGTPPREIGPKDILKDIETCKEHGRVVMRYATPPRTFSDTSSASYDSTVLVNTYSCDLDEVPHPSHLLRLDSNVSTQSQPPYHPQRHVTSPTSRLRHSSVDFSSPTHITVTQDYDDYGHNISSGEVTPHLQSPTHRLKGRCSRAESFHMAMLSSPPHSSSSSAQSPTISSPTSTLSNDSLMDSLKHAVINLTSKITGRRSSDISPSCTPRTKSASALDQLGVSHDITPSPSTRSPKQRHKDRRHRFVYNLARAYSDRMKNRSGKVMCEKRKHDLPMAKELAGLFHLNKQGGRKIGARMAVNKPIVLGTYTLPRHRPPRPKKSSSLPPSEDVSAQTSTTDTPEERTLPSDFIDSVQVKLEIKHDSGCLEDADIQDDSELDEHINPSEPRPMTLDLGEKGMLTLPSDAFRSIMMPLENTESDTNDEVDSESFYEDRFVHDLEEGLGDGSDVLRDSAVYSDDGAVGGAEGDNMIVKGTIMDTVKLIEEKNRPKPGVEILQVKRKEKAQGIQDILRTLEAAANSPVGRDEVNTTLSAVDSAQLKSVRERTRELVQCATLTRIRQSSCTVIEEKSPSFEEEDDEEDDDMLAAVKRGEQTIKAMVFLGPEPIPEEDDVTFDPSVSHA